MKTRSDSQLAALSATLLVGLILGGTEVRSQLVPIPLDYQRMGNQIVLSWTNAAFSLQAAPSVHGTFTNLPGATSPYTNALSGAQACFRLQRATPPAGMVLIPAGSFTMGDTFSEGLSDERPTHTVYISAFNMDKYEVTKGLWDTVRTWAVANGYQFENAGAGRAANHPVHAVNWFDVVKWCNARSQQEGRTPCYYTDASLTLIYKTGQATPYAKWNANGYRLPTEAEWEKSARGGAGGHRFPWTSVETIDHNRANYKSYWSGGAPYYPYDVNGTVGDHPTFNDGVEPYTSPVGYFAANGYVLYDVAGNVWEWCWDWFESSWYSNANATQSDPRGPVGPLSFRVLRGGSWGYSAYYSRCAVRVGTAPAAAVSSCHGFRCVRGL
jgi:formylglycine-generating enzyme required for sulfatase activity